MSAKRVFARVAGMVVLVVLLAFGAWAQKNEVSVTAGATFVSTQTIQNPPEGDPNPNIHFGNEETIAFNYSRFLKRVRIFGFQAEVPIAIYPRMDLNTGANEVPKDIGALFVTPSLRMNIFSGESVSPWVSVGGGYGRFREAPKVNYYGDSQGPTGTNTGVVQFGAGLDVWFWHSWGFRAEARDFYSGVPDLNAVPGLPVNTGISRQHNYYVGAGFLHRF